MPSKLIDEALFLARQSRWPEALGAARVALRQQPRDAEITHLVGVLSCHAGDYAEGIRYFRKALKLRADFPPAHAHLGDALIEIGNYKDARAALSRAVALNPQDAEAYCNLGYVAHKEEQYALAVDCYRRAISLRPDLLPAYNHLGVSLMRLDRLPEAEEAFMKALELESKFVPALANLAAVHLKKGWMEETETLCRQVLAQQPQDVQSLLNLGVALTALGKAEEAEEALIRLLALDHGHADAYSALAFLYAYCNGSFQNLPLGMAQMHGRERSAQAEKKLPPPELCDPPRLRVGVVSGDLRHHPVGFFLEGVLPFLRDQGIELFAYPTLNVEDSLTQRIRPNFVAWRNLQGKSDQDAARLIHKDGVHILIDLSGHTTGNRLGVFAWKPAPVQVSWLGYFATTGLAEIDYLMADPEGVPEACRVQFTEQVWYLPETRLCFTPPKVDLDVTPLPALRRSFLTFATFQAAAKIGMPVLRLWAKILAAIPAAKLRFHGKMYDDPVLKERFVERCRSVGLNPSQLEFHGAQSYEDYLRSHGDVDLIVDTFPYPGGTTTCEALWMGVPTLTLSGDTLLARQGASLLKAAGLPDWIARSEDEYVEKAVALAENLPRLAQLRAGLRAHVLASPLFNAPRFARVFETALWGMWREKAGEIASNAVG